MSYFVCTLNEACEITQLFTSVGIHAEKSSYFLNVRFIEYIFVFIIDTYYNTQN